MAGPLHLVSGNTLRSYGGMAIGSLSHSASVGRFHPGAADELRRRNAAGTRAAGREPDHRRRRGGRIATVGAAGVEVAQEALAEAQDTVLPLVPYLDTLRWVFVAAALAGIAVAIYARLDDWKARRR